MQTKKTLQDHVHKVGSVSNASKFVVNTRFIINHIRKTFTNGDDIASALESQTEFDFTKLMPVLQVSTSTDAAVKAREEKEFEIYFHAKINNFVAREAEYTSNRKKRIIQSSGASATKHYKTRLFQELTMSQ